MAKSLARRKGASANGFAGFGRDAFGFFRGLARHNDPLWFKPRKSIYDTEVLAPFRALIVSLSEKLEAAGIPLVGDPGRGIFRLYRDVRFSANKQLYKTHAGAVLTRSGGKGDPGLLYVHVEPGRSEAGIGFWHPEPGLLTKLRRSTVDDPDGFLDMVNRLDKRGYKLTTDARLARLPRGFEAAKGCLSPITPAGRRLSSSRRYPMLRCNRPLSPTASSISRWRRGRSWIGDGQR